MEEKALCPYCGAEMEKRDLGSYFWFGCERCHISYWKKCGHVCVGGADEPLTLEQIQRRRGKPIWVVPVKPSADWAAHWNILGDALNPSMLCRKVASIKRGSEIVYFLYESGYGETWVAYDYSDWGIR